MIACAACGAPVGETDTFCDRCGAPLSVEEPALTDEDTRRQARPLLAAGGAVVVAAIVAASLVLRGPGQLPSYADPASQRRAVEHFHTLVTQSRWEEAYPLIAEPPARDPSRFAALMAERELQTGRTSRIEIRGLRLHRSRSVALLEVSERVTLHGGRSIDVISHYVHHDDRWLFAFSADA